MRRIIGNLLGSVRLKRLAERDEQVAGVIRRVVKERLTYLEPGALCDLAETAIDNEKNHVEGIIIEAGCALGGSAITLASAKSKGRDFFVYDVFGMIPSPTQKDGMDARARYETIASGKSAGIGGKPYYGYETNLYEKVLASFSEFGLEVKENNIHLVRGLYEDTLRVNAPVALAHIDCDWYDSVYICLERIEPHLARGGVLILDDYYYWSGCKAAVDDYFRDRDEASYRFIKKSRLHILKQ
jgi:hypothetical protein